MIIVLLGPPGAGKGSQAQLLVERYDLEHISSGDLLRDQCSRDTETARKIKDCMAQGSLVPDELILEIMLEAILHHYTPEGETAGRNGVLLDGFPRTLAQARSLDANLEKAARPVDMAIDLEVDDDQLVNRITGRRSCPECHHVYHVMYSPPKESERCDLDGVTLVQRPDDTAEVVRNRIKTYHELTEPLIDYYEERGKLVKIDGNGEINAIAGEIGKVMDREFGSIR